MGLILYLNILTIQSLLTIYKLLYQDITPIGRINSKKIMKPETNYTGFLSELRAKLRDWAVRPVRAGCYPWAALSLIDLELNTL